MMTQILGTILISVVITMVIALALTFSQFPKPLPPGEGLDFTNTLLGKASTAQDLSSVKMRDEYEVQVRRYATARPDAPLLILVHGSGWHGLQFNVLARRLSLSADVIVPDLRGHGAKPGVRGDIAYIGQFEDDLADLVKATGKPDQKVVMGGHSSGGGLVLRFAGGEQGGLINAAVLMAPFLKYNAPTTRQNSGGWAYPLTRRIIGLSILNMFKIKVLNYLPIMQFRMPRDVLEGPLGDTATKTYSYRLNTGFSPRSDYLADAAALPRFILITGASDEAFDASKYAPTLSPVTDRGTYLTVEGVGHLDIVNAPKTAEAIESLLNDL